MPSATAAAALERAAARIRRGPGAAPETGALSVVVSRRFADARWGADASLVARTPTLNGQSVSVSGVLASNIRGFSGIYTPDIWISLSALDTLGLRERRTSRDPWLSAAGRLKAGVTKAQASADLASIAASLSRPHAEHGTAPANGSLPAPRAWRRSRARTAPTHARHHRRSDDRSRPARHRRLTPRRGSAAGFPCPPKGCPRAGIVIVSRGYFRALGIRTLAGDTFAIDGPALPSEAVVVDRRLASMLWPGRSPIGETIAMGASERGLVVGLVEDVQHVRVGADTRPELYRLARESDLVESRWLVARTSGPAGDVAGRVRDALAAADPGVPSIRSASSAGTDSPHPHPLPAGGEREHSFGSRTLLCPRIPLSPLAGRGSG